MQMPNFVFLFLDLISISFDKELQSIYLVIKGITLYILHIQGIVAEILSI